MQEEEVLFMVRPELTRWGPRWCLAQVSGPLLLPGPIHYCRAEEALGYARSLSGEHPCSVLVSLTGAEQLIDGVNALPG